MNRIKFRRGSLNNKKNIDIEDGEPIYLTDTKRLYVSNEDVAINNVYVGSQEPNDPGINVWINPEGINNVVDMIYPIGSIYLSVNNTSPSILFGGEWEQIKDRFLLAAGSSYSAGDYGGAASHVHTTQGHALTEYEMPAHSHASYLNSSSGNDKTVRGRVNYTDNSPAGWVDWSFMSTVGGNGSHSHGDTGSSSNMPPYLVVNIWKRIS